MTSIREWQDRLSAAAAAEAKARAAHAAAVQRRDELIRQALEELVPPARVLTATGLTRSRIYQIRDHR